MGTILVVDDDVAVIKILKTILEQEGYSVATAADGLEALSYLEQSRPDMILSDVMMPGMDGRDLCRRIKSDPAYDSIPIVLMSAGRRAADLDGCAYSAFLVKPFDIDALLNTVAGVIGEAC